MQLEDEKKSRELVDRKRSDLEAELYEVREDFKEALSARKDIGDTKTKLQTDYEELKKTAEANTAGMLEEREGDKRRGREDSRKEKGIELI